MPLAVFAIGLAGCATSGPLHIYSIASADKIGPIRDAGETGVVTVPSFREETDVLTGFAYDPFTDHFFLRLAPGNRLRVVDRPARAIKREFTVEEIPQSGGGDLAIKPSNGHIFLLHPTEPRVIELTRLGKWERTFALESLTQPAAGIAYDAPHDRLLVLQHSGASSVVRFYDLAGREQGRCTLARGVAGSLGFDSAAREIYATLPSSQPSATSSVSSNAAGIAVFDEKGRLVRTLPAEGEFADVGVRSFVRVF